MNSGEIQLQGGNMNTPVLKNNIVYKDENSASQNIHKLLNYLRNKKIEWVPQSFGIENGKHGFSFIPGNVIHDSPDWIFDDHILRQSARLLRNFHDATEDFIPENECWLLSNTEVPEVICHNDFAPYNWVFDENKNIKGLIDFDTCSPGSRIWDIAYTAYRIVPLMPCEEKSIYRETSPFSKEQMIDRLNLFLDEYSGGEKSFRYETRDVILKVRERLEAIADWSETQGKMCGNDELIEHGKMYRAHGAWFLVE